MKPARLIAVVVIGLALVGGALFFLSSKRAGAIEDYQKQAASETRYRRADVYLKGTDADKKYVDELFTYAIDAAGQDLGGLFSPPPSEQKFFTAVYQAMINQAKEQGKTDIAKSLKNWAVGQGFVDVKD